MKSAVRTELTGARDDTLNHQEAQEVPKGPPCQLPKRLDLFESQLASLHEEFPAMAVQRGDAVFKQLELPAMFIRRDPSGGIVW